MSTLKSRQLLNKLAKLSQKKQDTINKKEIQKKINQIKFLSSKDKLSKVNLRKNILQLERQLRGVLNLEEKLHQKAKAESKEIKELKTQIANLKKKVSSSKDQALRRRVERLSHLVGEVIAKDKIKGEVKFEEAKSKIIEKISPKITLTKINELQNRIIALKHSGKVSPEKIEALEERLTVLEKKLDFDPKTIEEPIKHKMMFGPETQVPAKIIKAVDKLEDDIDELPLPPPPIIKKR